MKEILNTYSHKIMVILLDIALVAFTFSFHKLTGFVIANSNLELLRLFLTETRELMNWVIALLVLIKVILELKKLKKQ